MALNILKIINRWSRGNFVEVADWKEMADAIVQWASQYTNNFKQIGLDLNGKDYQYNNSGIATQTTSIIERLNNVEAAQAIIGGTNLGLDLTDQSLVKLVASDGNDLSDDEVGYAIFNDGTNVGRLIINELTANITMNALTGCHWGFDTFGDLTDQVLWIYLFDLGAGDTGIGVGVRGGRETITVADAETAPGNVTSAEKIYVNQAPAAETPCVQWAWVKANFDDTGNPSGENYWEIQNGVGDVNVNIYQTRFSGVVEF